jgi:hypothetical protein
MRRLQRRTGAKFSALRRRSAALMSCSGPAHVAVFRHRQISIVIRLLEPTKFVVRMNYFVDPLSNEFLLQTFAIRLYFTMARSIFCLEKRFFVVFGIGSESRAPPVEAQPSRRLGRLMSSHPRGVTVARWPERSKTVVIADSTIAGPAIVCHGASASKS